MNKNLDKILAAREERYKTRINLHQKYNSPILVVTLNIPGPDKTNILLEKAFPKFIKELYKTFKDNYMTVQKEIVRKSFAGPEAFFVLQINYGKQKLKEIMINIEKEHFLGRILDLDVYGSDGKAVSRNFLKKRQRKCLICNQNARKCIIERRHSLKVLKSKVNNVLKKYLNNSKLKDF